MGCFLPSKHTRLSYFEIPNTLLVVGTQYIVWQLCEIKWLSNPFSMILRGADTQPPLLVTQMHL